jgi:hypothetical protein
MLYHIRLDVFRPVSVPEVSLAIHLVKIERIFNNSETLTVSVTRDCYAVRDHGDSGSFRHVG